VMEWQPIKTAPRDGTWVDLWRETPGAYGSPRVTARWEDDIDAWVWPDDQCNLWTERGRAKAERMICREENYFDRGSFTHWMPLPEPPK